MSKLLSMLLLLISLVSGAFAANNPADGYHKVNPAASTIAWNAKKVTGEHHGKIGIKDGTLEIKKGNLVGGSFTIDMNSIQVTDLTGGGATKLEGHLKSDDFFGTSTYPTATLIILDTKSLGKGEYDVNANLTIKGITKPVQFKATVKPEGSAYKAEANLTIDRSLFDVKYGSGKFFDGLGDKTIYDDFVLNVSLVTM